MHASRQGTRLGHRNRELDLDLCLNALSWAEPIRLVPGNDVFFAVRFQYVFSAGLQQMKAVAAATRSAESLRKRIVTEYRKQWKPDYDLRHHNRVAKTIATRGNSVPVAGPLHDCPYLPNLDG